MTDGIATTARSTFRLEYAVTIDIDATAGRIWSLVTDAAGFARWNTTIDAIDGTIAEGQRIALKAKIAPGRTFKINVSDVVPETSMTWSDGFAPMFRGVRTFRLDTAPDGRVRFSMKEVYSGLMLPLIAKSLPDFKPNFETWVGDLKRTAEQAA